jgi:hypothetical protein
MDETEAYKMLLTTLAEYMASELTLRTLNITPFYRFTIFMRNYIAMCKG